MQLRFYIRRSNLSIWLSDSNISIWEVSMYTDERGTFILRWAITRNGRRIVAKDKPFKIYIHRNK